MSETTDRRSVWQVSGGPITRSYSDVFIRYGVALIGPGDAGPWRAECTDDEFEGAYVRRFACEVQEGDIFLLRTGMSKIQAVGLIAGSYHYLPQFDDVNGWDLQHARRVRWFRLPQDEELGANVFGANPPRFSRVWNQQVIDYAERFVLSPPTQWQHSELPSLPEEEENLDEFPGSLLELSAQVHDLLSLYWDKRDFGDQPSEDEIVAHYVVPFVKALGWPVELIAVKWRYIDLCIFKRLPRIPENVHLIMEAKRIGEGLEGAFRQAMNYLDSLGILRDVVVTDGFRYRLYSAEEDFIPTAYANFARPKKSASVLFNRIKRS